MHCSTLKRFQSACVQNAIDALVRELPALLGRAAKFAERDGVWP